MRSLLRILSPFQLALFPTPPLLLPQLLDLSSNALSGTLPASLAVARGLTALKLRNNSRLVGTLPAALGAIPGLDTLDVRDTGMQAEVAGQAGLPPFLTLHPKWVGRAQRGAFGGKK